MHQLPFDKTTFHHVICNAVLHFAKNEAHFLEMFSELVRVLRLKGTLFVRMTSNIGFEINSTFIKDGVYLLPYGTKRFLLTRKLLDKIINDHDLLFIEPLKTVSVNSLRAMSTLVLQKN